MRLGTMFKQGDILLIPIPFTDLTANKKRPVLVISNNYYNKIETTIGLLTVPSGF